MDAIHGLSAADLRTLAEALRMGRMSPPYSAVGIQRYCPIDAPAPIASTLQKLSEEGATPASIASMLELFATGKGSSQGIDDVVDLVWTGPEVREAPSRDTPVVVRELFTKAQEHVLVAGYAVYQGKDVFRVLAERMDQNPELKVEMFLDVQRARKDTTISEDILRRFAKRFRTKEWPGKRMPDIYYDPRALEMDTAKKTSLHAKCVVIDRSVAFVSSANFTEAAQVRNIEVGALIKSPSYAARLVHHFQALAAAEILRPIPGLDLQDPQ